MTTETFTPVADAAKAITLRASIERIARKAEIMALDAKRGTPARQDAEEIRLLAGIAKRCLGGDNAQKGHPPQHQNSPRPQRVQHRRRHDPNGPGPA